MSQVAVISFIIIPRHPSNSITLLKIYLPYPPITLLAIQLMILTAKVIIAF